MAQRAIFPLPTEYKLERNEFIDSSRIINMYAIPAEDSTQKTAWVPVSGYKTTQNVGLGPARASFVFRGNLYWVSGAQIFELDSSLVPTLRGNIGTASGYVGITANENQVIFVDGQAGYLWDTLLNTFTAITFGTPILPSDVTVLDNYFVTFQAGQQKFYVSDLNNGLSWPALSFAIFQSAPDQLVACKALKRRLFLFGSFSTEVWYDAGATDFPFRRDNNSLFEHGVASPATVQEGFEVMFYVAQNQNGAAGVMMVEGNTNPAKVSSPQIDLLLQNVQSLSDSSAILYKENGFTFYQLSFTTDNVTLVYVKEINKWHEIQMPDGSRSHISTHAFFNNKHYVGLFNAANFCELSYRIYTFDNELIRLFLYCPSFFSPNNMRIRIDRLQLEASPGMNQITYPVQLEYPQANQLVTTNTEAKVILSISRDGGITYGNGIRAGIGKLGDYKHRVMWRRLGCYRQRRVDIRLEFPYKLPLIIIGAYIVFEELPE